MLELLSQFLFYCSHYASVMLTIQIKIIAFYCFRSCRCRCFCFCFKPISKQFSLLFHIHHRVPTECHVTQQVTQKQEKQIFRSKNSLATHESKERNFFYFFNNTKTWFFIINFLLILHVCHGLRWCIYFFIYYSSSLSFYIHN